VKKIYTLIIFITIVVATNNCC